MKRFALIIAAAAFTLAGQAQILKNNFMNGYKTGDKLEKSVYTDKKAPIVQDSWCGAFSANPGNTESPKVGAELSYPGYNEKGASILFGGFPEGTRSARFSVYSMTSGREYGKGTLYLSFLVNFSKLGARGAADFLGLSAAYVGGGNRANVFVAPEGSDKIRFSTSLLRLKSQPSTEAYDMKKTHLLVLKLDFTGQKVSLFVDPKLGTEEPTDAACTVTGDAENALKHAIRSVSFRNRSGYVGQIGNFRWCNSWAGVIAQ